MTGLSNIKRQLARRACQCVLDFIYATPFYPLTLKSNPPDNLESPPVNLSPGNIKLAKGMLQGSLIVANTHVACDKNIWLKTPQSQEVTAALHGFAWLADLHTLGTPAAHELAQDIIAGWIQSHNRWSAIAWRADVLGCRVSNWLTHHHFLLSEHSGEFRRCFLKSLAMQAKHLERSAAMAPCDARAFTAIKGLIHCGVYLPDNNKALQPAIKLLEIAIKQQILPDGGHCQRSPSLLLHVMRHLVDIRSTLIAVQMEVPAFLQGAIDRIAPMLRGLRLGDGGLPLFNGGAKENRQIIDSVLAQAGSKGKALSNAPHTGFQRLHAGRTTIIVDSGTPPANEASWLAHAGTLSFEMSVGKARLIVNCGSRSANDDAWHLATRSTAAHSTLCVDNKNSSPIIPGKGIICRRRQVICNRKEADGNIWLQTSHDGYQEALALTHQRNLYLDASGNDFRGEDILIGSGGQKFTINFHLHPQVHASLLGDGTAILLKLPGGSGWQFIASGGSVGLKESIYMGDPEEPRRTEQITVSALLHGDGATIKWRFHRIKG